MICLKVPSWRLQDSESFNIGLKRQLDEFRIRLEQSEAGKRDLKTQLEAKEELLKSNNQKQTQLQTDIDGLSKTVESLNQRLQVLCEPPKFVSTCKIVAVTVSSLKYLRQTCTSKLRQTSTFRRTVLPPSSGSHLYNGLAPHVYIYRVVFAICKG